MAKMSIMDEFRKESGVNKNPFEDDDETKEVNLEDKEDEIVKDDDDPKDDKEDEIIKDDDNDDDDDLDDNLTLKNKRKQEKEDKKENFANLRKAKDKYKAEAEQYKKEIESLKATASPKLKEAIEFIQDKTGSSEISVDLIKELFEVKESYEATTKEFEDFKRDIDIRKTKEWKQDYDAPYTNEVDNLVGIIVNTDDNGEIANKQYFAHLQQALFSTVDDKGNVTATAIKAVINKFADQYESATGEEYVKPMVSEVASSLRKIVKLHSAANEAYATWEEKAKERHENEKLKDLDRDEKIDKRSRRARLKMAHEAINSFNVDDLDGIIDETDIEEAFNSTHKSNEDQYSNPSSAMPYGDLLTLQAKGRMFDSLLERVKELEEELVVTDKDRGIRTSGKPDMSRDKKVPAGSWLGDLNPNRRQ